MQSIPPPWVEIAPENARVHRLSCYFPVAVGHRHKLTLAALFGGALFAAAVGASFDQLATALVASSTLAFHFGVFAAQARLQLYRDWRPVLAAAGLIAVHPVLFDRLQAAGAGVYGLTQPGFLKVLVHAGYGRVQTGFAIYRAVLMRQAATVGDEMGRLVDHLNTGDTLALGLDRIVVGTPLARSLQQSLGRLNAALLAQSAAADSLRDQASQLAQVIQAFRWSASAQA